MKEKYGHFELCLKNCGNTILLEFLKSVTKVVTFWQNCAFLYETFKCAKDLRRKTLLASIDFGYLFADIKILNLRKLIQSTLESGIDVGNKCRALENLSKRINVGP